MTRDVTYGTVTVLFTTHVDVVSVDDVAVSGFVSKCYILQGVQKCQLTVHGIDNGAWC